MAGTELQRVHDAARALEAERWRDLLAASAVAAEQGAPDVTLPGFPPEDVQQALNSAPATRKMDQAFALYREAMEAYATHGSPRAEARFLDFGTGWGRIWRYFLRDFTPGRMAAFDVNPKLADFWAGAMLGARLDVAAPFEPLPYEDDTFDLVVSNSVFSHLSERLNLHSARELHRIMRPGGIFVGTTFGRPQLKRWRTRVARGDVLPGRWQMRAGMTEEFDRALERYDTGAFAFVPTDAARPGDYEIAAFSGDWLRTNWVPWFETIGYNDDKPVQPVFVCRAKPA